MLRVFALVILASPAMAQEMEMPVFDKAVLDACLEESAGDRDETCIGRAAGACMQSENGYSTVGMNYCTEQELSIWDNQLNDAYKNLMAEVKITDEGYANEAFLPSRTGLLKGMQQNWIAYRDSACAFARSEFYGGSMAGIVGVQCLLNLTAKQALALEGYPYASDGR